jgi:prevent-host-death family protein
LNRKAISQSETKFLAQPKHNKRLTSPPHLTESSENNYFSKTTMSESITSADANRHFSQLLRGVREEGATYVVTTHGKPVAKIVPYDEVGDEKKRTAARKAYYERLRQRPVFKVEPWTRDELYD